MNKVLSTLQPRVRQYQVIAEIYHDQILGFDDYYGDYTALCHLIQVGEGTNTLHLTWSAEPLPDRSLVKMELVAARRHYHAPLTRTAHIGRPPNSVYKLAGVIVEAATKRSRQPSPV